MNRIAFAVAAMLIGSIGACTDESDSPSAAPPALPASITAPPPPTYDGRVSAVAADATSIYIAGSDRGTGLGDCQWRIEKRSLEGFLDAAFGMGGAIAENLTTEDEGARAIAIDGSFLFVAGTVGLPGAWRIEKRLATTGALVGSFGAAGVVTSDPTPGDDVASALIVIEDFLYVAGAQGDGSAWRIEKRDTTGGLLDSTFGVRVSDPTVGDDAALALATDGLSLFIAGTTTTTSLAWRIEKRALLDGALDLAIISDPTAGDDVPSSLGVAGGALFIAGWDAGGSNEWRIEKRSVTNGSLDATFGAVVSDLTAGDDRALALVIDGATLYVAGCDQGALDGGLRWRIEKRDAVTGALLPGIDEPGVDGEATALVADVSGTLVIAGANRTDAELAWAVRTTDK